MSAENVKKSTVVEGTLNPVKSGQLRFETYWILGVLVVALIILKSFIYIKDDKRHGK